MRRTLLITITIVIMCLATIAVFVIVVDPHQHFHKNATYSGNQRYEIGGIAKYHDYDAFVTGSSMAMNHYPAQIDSLMGWKTKNFTLMGAGYDDYAIILPYILSQGKTQNVIWGIDFFSLAFPRGAVPYYMYDNNLLTDCKYLWNYSILKQAIQKIQTGGTSDSILYHFSSPVSRKELQNSFRQKTENRIIDISHSEDYNLDTMRRNFDEIVVPIIRSHSNIHWHIYLPPYSIAEFIIIAQDGFLDDIIAMRAYMTEQLLELPNVVLYDFQRDPWITNLDEYMDTRHHSHEFNRKIIRSIKEKRYRADLDTVLNNNFQLPILVRQYADSLRH